MCCVTMLQISFKINQKKNSVILCIEKNILALFNHLISLQSKIFLCSEQNKMTFLKSHNCLYATSIYCFVLLSSFFLRRFRILLIKLIFGAWVPVWAQRVGILVPGHPFGHEGGHFSAWTPIWARGRAFWCPSACFSTWAGILRPRCPFGPAGRHFGTWASIQECGQAQFGARAQFGYMGSCPFEHFQRIPPGG